MEDNTRFIQAKEKIWPELLLAHHRFQIAVRRRDQNARQSGACASFAASNSLSSS
jgi:hypothetical protein